MSLFDNVYSTFQATSHTSTSSSVKNNNKLAVGGAVEEAQLITTQGIQQVNTSFDCDQLYKQKFNFYNTALNVYDQKLIVANDTTSSSSQREEDSSILLQKYEDNQKKILNKNRNRLHELLLPFDILEIIFGNMEYKDLLQCINVCLAWRFFIVNWLGFWRKIYSEFPQLNLTAIDLLIHGQAKEFQLKGPLDSDVIRVVLILLMISNNGDSKKSEQSCVRKLCFRNLFFSKEETRRLTKVAVSMLSVTHVEFIDCDIPYRRLYGSVLLAFSHAKQISIYQEHNRKRQPPTAEYMQPPTLSRIPYVQPLSSLVYLKLSCPYRDPYSNNALTAERLSKILSQCPNLVHLLLDTSLLNSHRESIGNAVLMHCPRLLNLAVTDNVETPKTYVSDIGFEEYDDVNKYISNKNNSKKNQKSTVVLERLIIMGQGYCFQNDTSILFCKYTHKKLKLLYLSCRLEPFFGEKAFYQLGSYRWPQLREIHLSIPLTHTASPKKATKVLVNLLSQCPGLEAITIDSSSIPFPYRLRVDDKVLESIARSCRSIRHLHILGDRYYRKTGRYFTRKGILQFSTKAGTQLEDLELDIPREVLVEAVKNLKGLKRLQLLHDNNGNRPMENDVTYYKKTIVSLFISFVNEEEEARRLLVSRGGCLVIT